jgi:8-oxo-dGTP pyrophosphatase MutT (NUDIX family)
MNDGARHDFAVRLTRAERDQSFANLRPRDAATLILIDRSRAVPQVLLGRRHAGHKFMPGKFVFPGGRVEPRDRLVPCATPLDAAVEAALMRGTRRPSERKARAFAVAALRETFEETGLLIGRKRDEAARAERTKAAPVFAEAGVDPDLGALHFIARAITPPRRPRRFDTRFFAADAQTIAERVDGIVGPDAELVELVWLPIAEAQRLEMSTITQVVLQELEARIAAGFGHDLPVPFYRMINRRFLRELL